MKFCAGITLFYPTKNELESILNYIQVFEKIYVYDNTDSIENQKINSTYFINNCKIEYIANCENFGLSVALNKMCSISILNSFDYICLLDQDSIINSISLNNIISYINSTKDNSVGIYTPEIIYHSQYKMVSDKNLLNMEGKRVKWAITSGSFLNLDIYKLTEGFDKNYFIDRLDYDYCVQLRELGYKIIKIKNTFLFQKFGAENRFMGFNISEYNVHRNYYIFRNRLYFYLSKHFSLLNVLIVIVLSISHLIKIIIETDSINKFKMIRRSVLDYYCNIMGKYDE